jgi:hypothetical protein
VLSFRYHAISIVAVLVALLVGLLLGVAIGDKNLVSSAEQSLRDNLRKDVQQREREIERLNEQLSARNRFEEKAYPLLVGGRLPGAKIAVIFLGRNRESTTNLVDQALQPTGATLGFDASIRMPMDLDALSARAAGTRYALMATDPTLVEPFGQRIGTQLVQGGKLIRAERSELFRSASGELVPPANGVVLVREHPDDMTKAEQAVVDAFEKGFMQGLRDTNAPVVGVETSDADPSQTDWFRAHGASTVSNLDEVAGRAALVFALEGNEGAYGDGSDEQLPPPAAAAGGVTTTP